MSRRWAWASIAIVSMWTAVLFTALFAPELESTSAGGDVTSLPIAGMTVALFAFIGTIVVAVQGFRSEPPAPTEAPEAERLERERLEARLAELEERMKPQDETPPRARARTLLGH